MKKLYKNRCYQFSLFVMASGFLLSCGAEDDLSPTSKYVTTIAVTPDYANLPVGFSEEKNLTIDRTASSESFVAFGTGYLLTPLANGNFEVPATNDIRELDLDGNLISTRSIVMGGKAAARLADGQYVSVGGQYQGTMTIAGTGYMLGKDYISKDLYDPYFKTITAVGAIDGVGYAVAGPGLSIYQHLIAVIGAGGNILWKKQLYAQELDPSEGPFEKGIGNFKVIFTEEQAASVSNRHILSVSRILVSGSDFYLLGSFNILSGGYAPNAAIFKINANTGEIIWSKFWGDMEGGDGIASNHLYNAGSHFYNAIIDSEGNLVCVGWIDSGDVEGGLISKIDQNGNVIFSNYQEGGSQLFNIIEAGDSYLATTQTVLQFPLHRYLAITRFNKQGVMTGALPLLDVPIPLLGMLNANSGMVQLISGEVVYLYNSGEVMKVLKL